MDASLKQILGINSTEAKKPAPMIPMVANPDRTEVRKLYRSVGMSGDIAASNLALAVEFHKRASVIITEECRGAAEAMHKVSSDLRPDIATARKVGIAQMAVKAISARLANAAVPLLRVIYEIRKKVDAAMNRQPSDPAQASLWFMRVADTRRQLEGMTPKALLKAAGDLAARGDQVFPEVFLNSLNFQLPQELTVELTKVYQRACLSDQMDALELAEEALVEIKAAIGFAEIAIQATCSGQGLPPDWTKIGVGDIVAAWPQATKASFIAAKGEEAYTALLQGRIGLESALGVFRPGLAEEA